MITLYGMLLLHDLADQLFSWGSSNLPGPPGFITDITSAFSTVLGNVGAPVRYFLPIAPVTVAAGTYLALIMALSLVKLGRRVLSLFTGGGGAL